jgi:hypothetical protein
MPLVLTLANSRGDFPTIKQAIISYEVKLGEPLVEEQIANKLGVIKFDFCL